MSPASGIEPAIDLLDEAALSAQAAVDYCRETGCADADALRASQAAFTACDKAARLLRMQRRRLTESVDLGATPAAIMSPDAVDRAMPMASIGAPWCEACKTWHPLNATPAACCPADAVDLGAAEVAEETVSGVDLIEEMRWLGRSDHDS
jgi:hypothetical protein